MIIIVQSDTLLYNMIATVIGNLRITVGGPRWLLYNIVKH